MPFHTEYRPNCFEDFIGNQTVVESLKGNLSKKNPNHAFLFTGSRGCGKTTIARIAANLSGCSGHNLVELDSAQFGNIDQIRDIRRKMSSKGLSGGNRGWILDEAHMLGEGGDSEKNKPQNAILKALEEPPSYVYFFLCTTDPQRLLKTVRDRCLQYELKPLTEKQIIYLLNKVVKAEEKEIPEEVLLQIAKDSQGRPRTALTILEKIIDLPERQMLRASKQSVDTETQGIDLCRALLKPASWQTITKILKGLPKGESEGVRRLVLSYCNTILLKEDNPQAYVIMDAFRRPFYDNAEYDLLMACYESIRP